MLTRPDAAVAGEGSKEGGRGDERREGRRGRKTVRQDMRVVEGEGRRKRVVFMAGFENTSKIAGRKPCVVLSFLKSPLLKLPNILRY